MTAPRLVTSDEPTTWYQHRDQRLFLADVVDPTVSDTMSVGFARYDAGAANTLDDAVRRGPHRDEGGVLGAYRRG
jgi:hypothetical protein